MKMSKKFKRQEYARYKKLGEKWRRPRGKTSKMRRYEAGKPAMPAIGYGSNRLTRYLHPSGFKDILIYNINDLEKLDPSNEAARISASIGNKKRLIILEKASELGIKILNKRAIKHDSNTIESDDNLDEDFDDESTDNDFKDLDEDSNKNS
jgi:large subunit ribosomal protein L32e